MMRAMMIYDLLSTIHSNMKLKMDKMASYMLWALLFFVLLFLLICITGFSVCSKWYHPKVIGRTEHFGANDMIPIEFVYADDIHVNNKEEHFDIFLLDELRRSYHVYIEQPFYSQNKHMMFKCLSEDCEPMYRMEYTLATNATSPTIANGDVDPERYIKVVEMFEDPVKYHSIPIRVKVKNKIRKGQSVKMETFEELINGGEIVVYFDESDDVRRTYDLFACVWDDKTKTPTCQLVNWEMGTKSEIDFGREKRVDMIRIKPKSKYIA